MLIAIYPESGVLRGVEPTTPLLRLLNALLPHTNLPEALNVAGRWTGILEAVGSPSTQIKKVLEGFVAEQPKVQEALVRLRDVGLITLEAGGHRFSGLAALADLQKLDARHRTLSLSADKEWGADEARAGNVQLTINAEGKLYLTHAALDETAAAERKLPVQTGEMLHQFELGAALSIGGDVGLDALKASLKAQAGTQVRWYFQRRSADSVINSLLDASLDLQQGVNPGRLADVFAVLDQSPAAGLHLDALRCIEIEYGRALGVKASASLTGGVVKDLAQIAGSTVKLNAGVSANFGFTYNRAGNHVARLTRTDQGVLLSVRRSKSKASTTTFSLDAGVSLEGVDQAIRNLVDQVLPEPPQHFGEWLEKWSAPGVLFRDKLIAKLDGELSERLQPLVPLLTGQSSSAEAAQAIANQLLQRVSGFLDRRRSLISEDVEALSERLLRYASQRLGLEPTRLKPVTDLLAPVISESLGELRTELDEKLQALLADLYGKTASVVESALRPLEAFGQRMSALVQQLDAAGTRLLAPVRKVLARYEALRKRLTKVAEQAVKLKISLSLGYAASRTRTDSTELDVLFKEVNAETSALFTQFVAGSRALDLDKAGTVAGVKVLGGRWATRIQEQREFTLTLNLFGFAFKEQRLLSSDLEVSLDASGALVMQTTIANEKRSETGAERRRARFSINADAVLGKFSDFSLDFTWTDDWMTAPEIRQFVGSLVAGEVVGPGAVDRVLGLVEQRPQIRSWRLQCALVPAEGFLEDLAAADASSAARLAFDELREALDGIKGSELVLDYPAEKLEPLVSKLRYRNSRIIGSAVEEVLKDKPQGGSINSPSSNLYEARSFLVKMAWAVQSVPDFIQSMSKLSALRVAPGIRVTAEDLPARVAQFDAIVTSILRASTPLADVPGMAVGYYDESLPRTTVALLRVLRQLAPDTLGASLTLTPIFDGEEPDDEDVILIDVD